MARALRALNDVVADQHSGAVADGWPSLSYGHWIPFLVELAPEHRRSSTPRSSERSSAPYSRSPTASRAASTRPLTLDSGERRRPFDDPPSDGRSAEASSAAESERAHPGRRAGQPSGSVPVGRHANACEEESRPDPTFGSCSRTTPESPMNVIAPAGRRGDRPRFIDRAKAGVR